MRSSQYYTIQIANYTTKLSQWGRLHDFECRPMKNPIRWTGVDALAPATILKFNLVKGYSICRAISISQNFEKLTCITTDNLIFRDSCLHMLTSLDKWVKSTKRS